MIRFIAMMPAECLRVTAASFMILTPNNCLDDGGRPQHGFAAPLNGRGADEMYGDGIIRKRPERKLQDSPSYFFSMK